MQEGKVVCGKISNAEVGEWRRYSELWGEFKEFVSRRVVVLQMKSRNGRALGNLYEVRAEVLWNMLVERNMQNAQCWTRKGLYEGFPELSWPCV